MKKLLVPALLLGAQTVSAASVIDGFYLSLMGHGSSRNSATFLWTLPPLPLPLPQLPIPSTTQVLTYKYKIGGGGSVALGYRCNQFRGELQVLVNTNSLDTVKSETYNYQFSNIVNPAGWRVKAKSNLFAGLVNGYIDIYTSDPNKSFVPYVGLGIGGGTIQHRVSYELAQPNGGFTTVSSDRTTNSTTLVQLIIGGNYLIDDFTSVGLDYRFLTTNTIKSLNRNVNAVNNKMQLNMINLKFNYSFDSSY